MRDIVALQLDAKDLLKLILARFRSKGRIATGDTTGISILVEEEIIMFADVTLLERLRGLYIHD